MTDCPVREPAPPDSVEHMALELLAILGPEAQG